MLAWSQRRHWSCRSRNMRQNFPHITVESSSSMSTQSHSRSRHAYKVQNHSRMSPPSNPQDYHVGWICAMQTECVAALRIPSTKSIRPRLISLLYDNTYTFGHIGHHNVIIAYLPKGKCDLTSAALVARDMLRSFTSIGFGLTVGIGGDAPRPKHDIHLQTSLMIGGRAENVRFVAHLSLEYNLASI